MRTTANKIYFLVGWLLSPFTFWNDAFINIPIAYVCANLAVRIVTVPFVAALVFFYWITNAIGLLIMYFSGMAVLRERRSGIREIIKLAVTMIAYSAILIMLNRMGIIKQF